MRRVVLRGIVLVVALFLLGWACPPVSAASDSETVVYITNTGKKYHRDGCRYLRKSKIKTTLKKAKADGYTPCKVCKPPK